MGKHSAERKKTNKGFLIIFILVLVTIIGIIVFDKNKQNNNLEKNEMTYSISSKTIEGEKLVIKGKADFARYVEFIFKDNILSQEKIYEQFDDKYKYELKKENYESQNVFKILKNDDKKMILEIEKGDLGSDEGLSYEEVYDKYVVQIVGEYEVVK